MKSRLIIIAVFALCLGGIGAVGIYRAQQANESVTPAVIKPAVVRCAGLQRRMYTMTESFYGLIEARATVDMAFQIPGRIVALGASKDEPLKENQTVQPGQVVAMLDPLRYEVAVQQAEAKMEESKAAMLSAEAGISKARAEYADAQKELTRMRELFAKGAAQQREVDKAALAVQIAKAQVDTADAALASASAMYNVAQAAASGARVNLADATLRAPMAAVVAAVPAEIGQTVQPAQPVMTLADMSKVNLLVGVVERKLPLLHEGQRVTVEVLALTAQAQRRRDAVELAQPRQGIVTVVPPAADTRSGVFKVEIELDNADGQLKPGMIGKAVVTVGQRQAIALPADAAVRSGEKVWAYFVNSGYQVGLDLGPIGRAALDVPATVVHRVELSPLAIENDVYLLTELPPGLDRLVIEGQSRLTDGQPVHVVPDQAMADVPTN